MNPRITTDPLRATDPNAIRVTYGLETGPLGAWMKAYNLSERAAGFVSTNPVEVRKGTGVEVEVKVGVEVDAACRTSCDFSVWSATAFA